MNKLTYKVPNGKLLKVFLDTDGDIIKTIKITGDFFIYPEEKIEVLESALKGEFLDEILLIEKLNNLIKAQEIELYGLNTEAIVQTVMQAKNKF